jgi:hypothetical protein
MPMNTQGSTAGSSEPDTQRMVRPRADWVTVRDVVRHGRYRLTGAERMLRVPYDLYSPIGPVQYEDGMITYLQGSSLQNGSAVEHQLGEAHQGERVLLRLPDSAGNEWWLCEVEQVDDEDED